MAYLQSKKFGDADRFPDSPENSLSKRILELLMALDEIKILPKRMIYFENDEWHGIEMERKWNNKKSVMKKLFFIGDEVLMYVESIVISAFTKKSF